MRKRIIAGNWKMYKTVEEVQTFANEVKGQVVASEQVDVVICPPALYLADLAKTTEGTAINIGAQTMHDEAEGAFTGEVSAAMLKSIGVHYAIIGHSERRQYFNETDESVNRKVHAALKEGITPLVCVGETLEDREAGITVQIVSGQVEAAFKDVLQADVAKTVIAYEPIWAIGTGKTATADDANEVCGEIRAEISRLYGEEIAEQIRLQYGGSVNPANIVELLSKEHIDGALVGGASLQADSFLKLVEAGSNE